MFHETSCEGFSTNSLQEAQQGVARTLALDRASVTKNRAAVTMTAVTTTHVFDG